MFACVRVCVCVGVFVLAANRGVNELLHSFARAQGRPQERSRVCNPGAGTVSTPRVVQVVDDGVDTNARLPVN